MAKEPEKKLRPRWRQPTAERDAGIKARAKSDAVPEACNWDDDATSRYQGPQLAAARAKRPTNARIAKLEEKTDAAAAAHLQLVTTVGDLGQAVGRVVGQLEVLPRLVENLEKAVERMGDDQANAKKHSRERWTIGFRGLVKAVTSSSAIALAIGWLVHKGCNG